MEDQPNDGELDELRSAVETIAQDEQIWSRFIEHPEAVLAESGQVLPPNVSLMFHQSPLGYDSAQAIQVVRCAVGWEARLTFEWRCVCAEWVEIVKLGPLHVPEPPPEGFPQLPWPAAVRDHETLSVCARREWRETPVWTCVRSARVICR
jgi:hypothetical protein